MRPGPEGSGPLIDYFHYHVRKTPDMVCLVDPVNKIAPLWLKPERLTHGELGRAVV
jgi:hypothetical protein